MRKTANLTEVEQNLRKAARAAQISGMIALRDRKKQEQQQIPGEALLEEADPIEPSSLDPEAPSSSVDQTSDLAPELPLPQTSTESSVFSEGNPSLH